MIPTDPAIYKAVFDVAAQVQTDGNWLIRLIDFESRWNPQAESKTSSAKGLIQFIDSTARDLGYTSASHLIQAKPTAVKQLYGPVLQYLEKYAPLDTDQKLFMAVFYPPAMEWPIDREFPESVQAANPGIKTVRDYINKVYRRPDPYQILIIAAAAAGVLFYFILQGR